MNTLTLPGYTVVAASLLAQDATARRPFSIQRPASSPSTTRIGSTAWPYRAVIPTPAARAMRSSSASGSASES
jgi:hypothetical protein